MSATETTPAPARPGEAELRERIVAALRGDQPLTLYQRAWLVGLVEAPAPAGGAADARALLDWIASREWVTVRCHGEGLYSVDTHDQRQARSSTGLNDALGNALTPEPR